MTINLDAAIKIILLDIEGTTTPIDFVVQVLFPYARTHLKNYLAKHWDNAEVQADLLRLQAENIADAQPLEITHPESVMNFLVWLMDQDRKSTPLKSLQGKVWEEGYRSGELKSRVFADVPVAFTRWQQQQKRVCIFSSGSILAQKLLFEFTEFGNLSSFISGWFDTNIGAKKEAESYQRVAAELNCRVHEILFISDVTAELQAARSAGMPTILSVRSGNQPQPDAESFAQVQSFAEIIDPRA